MVVVTDQERHKQRGPGGSRTKLWQVRKVLLLRKQALESERSHTMDNKGCLNKEQASKQATTRNPFCTSVPSWQKVTFDVLYIRELWRNFVTYIVINSLYIAYNQVN